MPLRDPFAAYDAGDNLEAHLVCGLLRDAGIEATVVEDVSQAGVSAWGLLAGIHKPQVWIERDEIERARPVLTEYERRNADRRAAERAAAGRSGGEEDWPIDVPCEECGTRSEFPAALRGTVQSCPRCRAFVDVENEAGEGWGEAPEEEA